MKFIFLTAIAAYRRFISPFTPPRCRYTPTCSAYAYEAVTVHGAVLGVFLTVYRVLRCNPFSRGGYDPVPPKDSKLW